MLKSKIIVPDKKFKENCYFEFVDFFSLDRAKEITLRISADSEYVCYINGEFVSCGQYGDFDFYKSFDEIDISEYVQMGKNKIAVLVQYYGKGFSTYIKKDAGLIFDILHKQRVIAGSGKNTLARLSKSYLEAQIISGQLGFNYSFDKTKCDGWYSKDAKLTGFKPSKETDTVWQYIMRPIDRLKHLEFKGAALKTQGFFMPSTEYESHCQNLMYGALSHCVRDKILVAQNEFSADLNEQKGMYFVFDLKCESVGYLSFDIETNKDCKIDFSFGEHLDSLRVSSAIHSRCFNITYIAREGKQEFTGYLRKLGLRYLQVYVHSDYIKFNKLGIVPVEYTTDNNKVLLSDGLHQKIYDTAFDTLKLCMHEHYEDCPWREQAQYAMDSRVQILAGYYAFNELNFAKQSLKLMSLKKREDGLIHLCSPSELDFTIPSFSLAYVLSVYEYYMFSGDLDGIKDFMPVCKTIIKRFKVNIFDSLLSCLIETPYWNFIEWTEGMDGHCIIRDTDIERYFDLPTTALYIKSLESLAYLLKKLNEISLAEEYLTLVKELKIAARRAYYNEEEKVFNSFITNGKKHHLSELSNALALWSGIADDVEDEIALKLINGYNWNESTLSMKIFKYDALLKSGEKYLPQVLKEIEKIWGKMVFDGATSFYETALGSEDFSGAGSLCHGWSAVPIYVYYKYVLGFEFTDGKGSFSPKKSSLLIDAEFKLIDKKVYSNR